jgi:hypothetical protein
MSHNFLSNANFHFFLNSIDQELAHQTQERGCSECGHKLHQANYPRSPVGIPLSFRNQYDERLSFCCDTCRKRITPPSVRFFGRRWYPAPLFIFISALMRRVSGYAIAQIKGHFGINVSESTWKRWRQWWRESFIETLFWRQNKGIVPGALEAKRPFPRALLDVFQGTLEEKMGCLLKFLSPLSCRILQAF